MTFKKSDIKTGMIIETEKNGFFIVMDNSAYNKECNYFRLNLYNEDLTPKNEKVIKIKKIYKPLSGDNDLSLNFIFLNEFSLIYHFGLVYDISEEFIDFSKLPVDTKILVKDNECHEWTRRYFAKFEDGKIYAWEDGKTSFTANKGVTRWSFAKLYKEEE